MTTNTKAKKATVQSKSSSAVKVAAEVEVTKKPTAAERLAEVLVLIDRQAVIDLSTTEVKFGKAVGLQGGGSVYINRSNADIRLTTGQVAALAKTIKGSAIRGPQGNYLRIAF